MLYADDLSADFDMAYNQVVDGFKTAGRYIAEKPFEVATGLVVAVTSLLQQGCCPSYFLIDEEGKQPYLQEKEMPFNYSAFLDCKCQEKSEQGDVLGDLATRLGWGLAAANDVVEHPLAAAADIVAGESARDFFHYILDGLWGGRTYNEAHAKALALKFGEALDVANRTEDSGAGALVKNLEVIGADVLAAILLSSGGDGGGKSYAPSVDRSIPSVPPQ